MWPNKNSQHHRSLQGIILLNIWWFPEIGVPPNHPIEWDYPTHFGVPPFMETYGNPQYWGLILYILGTNNLSTNQYFMEWWSSFEHFSTLLSWVERVSPFFKVSMTISPVMINSLLDEIIHFTRQSDFSTPFSSHMFGCLAYFNVFIRWNPHVCWWNPMFLLYSYDISMIFLW